MLSNYQLKITDIYKTPTGNVKKLLHNVFDKKCICFIMKFCNFLRLGFKLKNTLGIIIQSINV